jgi:hypothetical protein
MSNLAACSGRGGRMVPQSTTRANNHRPDQTSPTRQEPGPCPSSSTSSSSSSSSDSEYTETDQRRGRGGRRRGRGRGRGQTNNRGRVNRRGRGRRGRGRGRGRGGGAPRSVRGRIFGRVGFTRQESPLPPVDDLDQGMRYWAPT